MTDRDDDASTVPVLDYGRPPPDAAGARNGPAVRFTCGAAVPILGLLAIDAFHGEDMICCDAIGVVVELFVIGSTFQIGQRLCRLARGRAQVERHRFLTVGAGVVSAALTIGTLTLIDVMSRPIGGLMSVAFLFALPVSAPWVVCRNA